ncbi:MAG: HAD hydrolase-like protein [Nostoc sp.]
MKGIILGIDNILATGKEDDAQIDSWILNETGRLINFLQKNGIQPIVLANRDWFLNGQRLKDFFNNKWGDFQWFIANIDGTPHKPSKDSINHVLSVMGWNKNETVYLGNTDADMKTAVNGGLLFLNAIWYSQTNSYGFEFDSPKDVARFIDIFCLRKQFWNFAINHQNLEYYALGIYATREEKYSIYSNDARGLQNLAEATPIFG